MKQLDGKNVDDLEEVELQPIELGMPVLKEIGVQWLVGMAEYVSNNPQFIVNGFVRSGITSAIDDVNEDSSDDELAEESDETSDYSSSDDDAVES